MPRLSLNLIRCLAIACLAVGLSGCADGVRQLFAPSQGYVLEPGPMSDSYTTAVEVKPGEIVAPINSEVVIVSTTYGANGAPLGGQRVEWMLSQGGVGEFVTLGDRDETSLFHNARGLPKKINNTYAVGESSPINVLLTRGTPSRADDVAMTVGQTWVSVTSPVEGTSYVSAFGPDVYSWERRRGTATISWVDAKWTPPPPAVVKVGEKHILTTTVTRQSDGTPLVGWRVRYEILGQAPGAIASPADGSQVIEVATNEAGKASAEIGQPSPTAATVPVNVQLFRPTDPANPNSKRAMIGSVNTQITWVDSAPVAPPVTPPISGGPTTPPATGPSTPTAAGTIALQIVSPDQVAVGEQAKFTINVTNNGTTPATGLIISDRYEAGLEYRSGQNPIENNLNDIAPGATLAVNLNFTVRQPGRQCHTAEVRSAGGQRVSAQGCVIGIAPPQPASFDVGIAGPKQVTAGTAATFTATVVNTGTQTIPHLRVVMTPDASLLWDAATGGFDPVEEQKGRLVWSVTNLPAGKSTPFQFRTVPQQPANGANVLCEVSDDAGTVKTGKAGVDILPGSTAAMPATNLTVDVASTVEPVKVGGQTKYQIVVTNAGQTNDKEVVVSVSLPPQVKIVEFKTQPGFLRGVADGQNNLKFDSIKEFRAGESMSFEITAQALAAADAKVNVQVVSQGHPQPVAASKGTSIFAE